MPSAGHPDRSALHPASLAIAAIWACSVNAAGAQVMALRADNTEAMSTLSYGIPTSALLAAVILGMAMALGLLITRAGKRSERAGARQRASDLFRLLGGRLAGSVPPRALRQAVQDAEADSFWDAIEAIAATLRLTERFELARSLEKNRHAAHERRALRDEDNDVRREVAARRLGLLPSALSRRTLRRALLRGPEAVRFAAARSLAAHRDRAALRWILQHPHTLARRPVPALSGLLRGFGPASRALLVATLERGIEDAHMECALVDALGVSRCRSARRAIEARLRSPHTEVRIAACRALGRLGERVSAAGLVLALADESWPVRALAAQALGRLGAADAVEALIERVSDRSWWVRHHAAHALAAVGSEGRDALCELVVRSEDPYAREMAREALDQRFAPRRSA